MVNNVGTIRPHVLMCYNYTLLTNKYIYKNYQRIYVKKFKILYFMLNNFIYWRFYSYVTYTDCTEKLNKLHILFR